MAETRTTRLLANCYNCGRFVGKDGNMDLLGLAIADDGTCDGWEPECGRCIRQRAALLTRSATQEAPR